jgi:pimeloyl-ACP methyl ester carboxylesterase
MIATNNIQLNVETYGKPSDPLVILLHGFPEAGFAWRKIAPQLAEKGYFVLAPDQRGYNLSEKPSHIADYRLDLLAGDILGLMDAYQQPTARVVGHDWGAVVAWYLAMNSPERVKQLAILNVPHPSAMLKKLRTFTQLRKSWYMFFFQIPALPEWLISRNNFQLGKQSLVRSSLPNTFTESDLAEYVLAWQRAGNFKTMLHWYRALFQKPAIRPKNSKVASPTLILWGKRDAFLSHTLAEDSLAYCLQGELQKWEDATHWLCHEHPGRVSAALLSFFAKIV